MRRAISMVAILSVALVGCGGSDLGGDRAGDGAGDSGDAASDSGDAASADFCKTALDIAEDLAGFEDDFESEDFYSDIANLYRRLGDAASGDLADDFDRAVDGFEEIAKWSEDPTSDYPFSDAEDAELEASMNRIEAASEACGIDVGGDDSADGPDSDATEPDSEESTLTFDDGENSGEVTFGGELPDDFPFPVPSNYEVSSSFEYDDASGTTFTAVLNAPEADFDTVANLYEDFLNAEGFDVEKTDFSTDGAKFVLITGERSNASVGISMSTEEVANDAAGNLTFETLVSLTWVALS